MMKHWLAAAVVTCTALPGIAQDIVLSQYSFQKGQQTIGTIHSPSGTLSQLRITGPDAKLFTLNSKQELVFKKKSGSKKTYQVGLEAVSAGRKIQESFQLIENEFKRNQVIAHRGAWKHTGAAQNSIGSLQGAIKLGCYGSELDIHMSADSVLFVNHDAHIQEVVIEKATKDQLSTIVLKNGEKLPTLGQYLTEGLKQRSTKLILEIKTSTMGKERSLALTERVVRMVRAMKAQAWVEYIAFDYDVCKKVRALDPYAKVAYLMGDKTPEELAADHLTGFDYHFKVIQAKEPYLEEARRLKLTTNVWTVNDPELMKWLLERKVDFLTTDEPEEALTLVK